MVSCVCRRFVSLDLSDIFRSGCGVACSLNLEKSGIMIVTVDSYSVVAKYLLDGSMARFESMVSLRGWPGNPISPVDSVMICCDASKERTQYLCREVMRKRDALSRPCSKPEKKKRAFSTRLLHKRMALYLRCIQSQGNDGAVNTEFNCWF